MTVYYEITMQHSEKSFEALSHMQYDLFCKDNRIGRTIISGIAVIVGVVNFSAWWGILLVGYGCYLTTSTYVSANRTAHKLAAQLESEGRPFPASIYRFLDNSMEILSYPDKKKDGELAYKDIRRVGEDGKYFYIFRDEYGGYMIPKEELGERRDEFRDFIEGKSAEPVQGTRVPILRFINWVRRKRKAR